MIRVLPTCVLLVSSTLAANPASQELRTDRTYPDFGFGPTGIVARIESGHDVHVVSIVPGSPAAGTELATGDVILKAEGLDVATAFDPRVPLGNAIGLAEEDGRLNLEVRRGDETLRCTVELTALGAYGAEWPDNCAKSRAIIESAVTYVLASQGEDGAFTFGSERPERDGLKGCLAGLFLLSTGDDAHLDAVRRQVVPLAEKAQERPTTSNWHLGYQGILLAEYHLRTGDDRVLPGLASLCEQAVAAQAAGAWGHGGIPGPGYVQSGLMSSAGVPVLTTLLLASECGIDVDRRALLDAVRFFYRMAGHGCVPYGDHRSELWWSNTNGRNGMLACALALSEQRELSLAASHLATLVADSYHQPEFGHTGGGFNVIWRGLASIHVPEERRGHYERQMRELAWYYDLCRQPDGGFSILPTPPDNKRYQGLGWGTGAIGLTYTAPLRTLRITGAPRSAHSHAVEPFDLDWGTERDQVFLSTADAEGFGEEESDPREVYGRLLGRQKSQSTVEFEAKHLRHYSPLVRSWAARALASRNDEAARTALGVAASHPDPRVRRAAFDGLSGYDNWSRPMRGRIPAEEVSRLAMPAIARTLDDPEAGWWEIDGALFALGRARPEDIRSRMSDVLRFAEHEEWYLRESAFWALVGLGDAITTEEFERVGAAYLRSQHVFERASFDGGFRDLLGRNRSALDRATVVAMLGDTTHSPRVADGYGVAAVHEAAHRTMMVLRHFDDEVYEELIDDFVLYLSAWEPYHQHSKWLISGSKWQDGLLLVLDRLGADGADLRAALGGVLERWSEFDPGRMGKDGKALEETLRQRLAAWDELHG